MFRLRVRFYRSGVPGKYQHLLKSEGRLLRPKGSEEARLAMQAIHTSLSYSMLEVVVYLDQKKPHQPYQPIVVYDDRGFRDEIRDYDFADAPQTAECL